MANFDNIIQEINENLPDNNQQLITPAILRETLIDFVNKVEDSDGDLETAIQNKQDTLTFDATPAENSANPVTSAGIYDSLSNKADKVQNAIAGNFAGLDSNGNIVDSGSKARDFVPTYVAIPNQTTFNEITSALSSEKIVIVNENGRIYTLSAQGISSYTFAHFCKEQNRILTLTVTPDGWTNDRCDIEDRTNKVSVITGNETSSTKYPNTKAVADALGKWGVISQTQTWTGSNAAGFDYTMSDLVWGNIPKANIDLFENAGALFNDTNEDIIRQDSLGFDVTHKIGCFYLDGMGDISYKEMLNIYEQRWSTSNANTNYSPTPNVFESTGMRYGLITFGANWNTTYNLYSICSYNSRIEVIHIGRKSYSEVYISPARQCFNLTSHLKKVLPILNCSRLTGTGSNANTFYGSFASDFSLEEIRLKSLVCSVSFSSSSRLSFASVFYMVENAANTTAITITLHADALARCVADTTEYEYNGNTYTGIVALATAKNITLASA